MRGRLHRGRTDGYTLFEMMVVMMVMLVAFGAAYGLLVEAHHWFGRAMRGVESRSYAALAVEAMLRDIRSSCDASTDKGALVLIRRDGSRVTWRVEDGHLRREGTEGGRAYKADVARMIPEVHKAGGRPFVEVGLRVRKPDGREGQVFYIAASPRIEGAAR